jgi:hypothetical protein
VRGKQLISWDMARPWNYTTLTVHVAIWHIFWSHRCVQIRYNYHKTGNLRRT